MEAMTGGVLARLLGAGEAGALKASTSRASPSGRLMVIAALFRTGLAKAGDCAEMGFVCEVVCGCEEAIEGVCG